jgi:hypothetical protein
MSTSHNYTCRSHNTHTNNSLNCRDGTHCLHLNSSHHVFHLRLLISLYWLTSPAYDWLWTHSRTDWNTLHSTMTHYDCFNSTTTDFDYTLILTCHSLLLTLPALRLHSDTHWLTAWSVDWYSLRALQADSLKTPLATSVLLSRHVPRHYHPGSSLVCWPLPSRKRSPTVAQSLDCLVLLLLPDVTCTCAV